MSPIKFLAAALGALVLASAGAAPVLAQTAPPAGSAAANEAGRPDQARGTRGPRGRQNRDASPTPGPEEVRAAAQAQIAAAGLACQVTEAVSPGETAEQTPLYEAACADAPGYILIASSPPQAFNCLELAGSAAATRRLDPDADVGQQCILPANQNSLAVIGGWARSAGVTCTIDEALAVGRSNANAMIYEVGCAGVDGYWLEEAAAGWSLKDCLQVASTGGTCHFTTAREQSDGFEPKLAGTDAAACDVAQVRLMGQNANGRFYEAKCGAEGEGYIVRVNTEGATQQVYPCAVAQRIGGGCTLTPAPPPGEQ